VLRRVLRSIVGVVTGYVVFVASNLALFQLTGQPPHRAASVAFMLGASAYGTAFALLGGYVSAWITGRRPVTHAAAMAAILALGATVSLLATVGKGAIWTQICALAFMTPAAVAGGWLRQRIASAGEASAAANLPQDLGPCEP
jgi:ABC-type Mn2+/Zn2+ transport system permease subunit